MSVNVIFSTLMVALGPAVQILGRWGSSRLADVTTDSDIYTNRVHLHWKYSSDRAARMYYQAMGADMPFESRAMPVWMEIDAKQALNYSQYKDFDWRSEIPPTTEYALQNRKMDDAIRQYDAEHAYQTLYPQQYQQWKKDQYAYLEKQIALVDAKIAEKKEKEAAAANL